MPGRRAYRQPALLLPRSPVQETQRLPPHSHHPRISPARPGIELTPLEDRESIQVALSVVINALATGNLESKRATALLYGLQIASANSAKLHWKQLDTNLVRTAETTSDGIDLAEPGATYEPPIFIFDDDESDDLEEEQISDDLISRVMDLTS